MDSGKVIELFKPEPAEEEKLPHASGEAICSLCKYTWVAVTPVGTVWFECPECHAMKGHFKYVFQLNEDHWTCSCGNDLFCIVPQGIYCINCGSWQSGY